MMRTPDFYRCLQIILLLYVIFCGIYRNISSYNQTLNYNPNYLILRARRGYLSLSLNTCRLSCINTFFRGTPPPLGLQQSARMLVVSVLTCTVRIVRFSFSDLVSLGDCQSVSGGCQSPGIPWATVPLQGHEPDYRGGDMCPSLRRQGHPHRAGRQGGGRQ